jgi:diadenosine tetraphosphate (Ap4A) HIT family hydrolase
MPDCPFCKIDAEIIAKNDSFFAIRDGFPVSDGHTLLIPHRHVTGFFELTEKEQHDLLKLLNQLKVELDNEFSPDGFNIGINNGKAAGQTIMHLHVHLIPRFDGDVADPRGGVRWVKPDKAVYWAD